MDRLAAVLYEVYAEFKEIIEEIEDEDMTNPATLRQIRQRLRDWSIARLGNVKTQLDEFENHVQIAINELTRHIGDGESNDEDLED